MKKYLILSAVALLFAGAKTVAQPANFYPIEQVNLNQVELTDNFWLPLIRTVQGKTIAYSFKKCEEEGRMENFVTAGDVIRGKQQRGAAKARGTMVFDDTDVYKTIEGAAYSLTNAPNDKLSAYIDSVIALVAYAQEPDGYLSTWRTINPRKPTSNWVRAGGGRWYDLGMSHELYNAGHLYEAASAHYWATGKRNFLDIALRNADMLVKTFMTDPVADLHLQVPGHQIVETGLIKLFQITGKKQYLQLAKQFLDNRGKNKTGRGDYSQDHQPVVKQDEAVGHAVRAVYMYAGMTDIAAIYGDTAYRQAIDKIWDNVANKKIYLTGGLGARHDGEAFGKNYELPNKTAYNETCAAIGGVYWADRLFRLNGNAKYFNVLERILYNGVIAGISHSGTEFFYPNPLESDGNYKFNHGHLTRASWFDCSCCPTNLIRFIPYMPNLIYATSANRLYVNLFVANKAKIKIAGQEVSVEQKTNYPWDGKIEIVVTPEKQEELTLKIRIPAWVQNRFESALYHFTNKKAKPYSIKLNGKMLQGELKSGYFEICRVWKKGDKITLDFPMEIRTVEAAPEVEDDAGKYAVEYGTLVYCYEKPLEDSSAFPSFLTRKQVLNFNGKTLIPYYSWANRGVSEMKVWFGVKSEFSDSGKALAD
ncbi:MAG: glycoside hydrolase family 127 protein [Dysgonamonadaceae bacterium]|jgi:DUF1680 family protein|nr:glycoside hydrolase family 127 protein [Dysgonamonadaceae bacterium]